MSPFTSSGCCAPHPPYTALADTLSQIDRSVPLMLPAHDVATHVSRDELVERFNGMYPAPTNAHHNKRTMAMAHTAVDWDFSNLERTRLRQVPTIADRVDIHNLRVPRRASMASQMP